MLRPLIALATVGALSGSACPASGQAPIRVWGPHPLDLDGHWYEGMAEQIRSGLTVGEEPFGEVDGVRVFLADPVAYGWRGDVWIYRNTHPLPGGLDAYCDVPGEHAHPFAPEGAFRRESDGVYAFVGALRGGRDLLRPARMAPRIPLVTEQEGPPIANLPFWFAGCLHGAVLGPGGQRSFAPLFGCRAGAIRARPAAPAPRPPDPTRRTRRPPFETVPARRARRPLPRTGD